MTTRKRSTTILTWLISLINPPPLQSMHQVQKITRVFLFTSVLVVLCVLFSMLAAVGIFTVQQGRHMFSGFPQLVEDLAIIFLSMIINTICVLVLLNIKSADQKLIPPSDPSAPSKPGSP